MHLSHILPLLIASAALLRAAEPASLLSNGDFEQVAEGKAPDGWTMPAGAAVVTEGKNHFLRLTAAGPSTQVSPYREVATAGAKAVTISFRVRYADIKRGAQPWHDARIIMDAKDAEKKPIKGVLPHPFFTGSSGWVERSVSRVLPAEAVAISIMPALFMVEAGTFDIDDIRIVPCDPAKLPADLPKPNK